MRAEWIDERTQVSAGREHDDCYHDGVVVMQGLESRDYGLAGIS